MIHRDGRILAAAPVPGALWVAAAVAPAASISRYIARGLRSRLLLGSIAAIPLVGGVTAARAQNITPLVPLTLDPEYNRGRNLSVTEQYQPAFEALGYRLGSITAYPSVTLDAGATTNVYTNNRFKRSDAFYFVKPAVYVTSDLPMHKLALTAGANIQRYAHETLRNQEAYYLQGDGQLDIGPNAHVYVGLDFSRASEEPYASDLDSDISVLSQYTRISPSVRAVYQAGRTRLTAKVDKIRLRFSNIVFADGRFRDQRERNQTRDRISLQAEYALSPSIAAFAQANYDATNYEFDRGDGAPNRDGDTTSILGGVSFDLAGLMRGSVAAGYTRRAFDASNYPDADGSVVQMRTEFFPTPLTTVGLGVQRSLQDSSSPYESPFTDTRASVSVDHALLRNLLLSGSFVAIRQKRLITGASRNLTQTVFSARYQSNRSVSIGGTVQYRRGRPGEQPIGVPFDELSGYVTLRLRR